MMIQHWRMPTTQHVTTSRLVNSFARNTNLYTSFLHRRHVSAVSGSFFRPRLPQISRRHTTAPPTQGLDDPQSKAQERAQELEYTLRISMQTVKIAKSHNLHDWEGAARILHNFLPEVEKFCKDSSTNSSIHSRHMRQLATIADKVQFLLTSKFATAGGPQATQGLIVSLLSAMADNDIIHEEDQVKLLLQELTDVSGLPDKDIFFPLIPATLATLNVGGRLLIAATPDRFKHIGSLSAFTKQTRRSQVNKLIRQCNAASHTELTTALDSEQVDKVIRLPGVLTVFGPRAERKSRCRRCRNLFDVALDDEMSMVEETRPDTRVFPSRSCCENQIALLCALAGLPVDVVG